MSGAIRKTAPHSWSVRIRHNLMIDGLPHGTNLLLGTTSISDREWAQSTCATRALFTRMGRRDNYDCGCAPPSDQGTKDISQRVTIVLRISKGSAPKSQDTAEASRFFHSGLYATPDRSHLMSQESKESGSRRRRARYNQAAQSHHVR